MPDQRGYTLIEVMIAITAGLLVIVSGFTIMNTTEKASSATTKIADAQQNARVAMELISRDLRMAGFGMKAPVGNCASAIVPNDKVPGGADNGPDSIQLVVPAMSADPSLWKLAAAVLPPASTNATQNTITLQANAVAGAGVTFPAVVSIGGAWSGTVNSATGDVLTVAPTNLISRPFTFPVGTQVYWLQCITYQVIPPPDANNVCAGRAPCLARGVTTDATNFCNVAASPCVPVVDGIEDIQFAYACDGCITTINSGIPNGVIDDQGTTNLNVFDAGDFITNSSWAAGSPPLDPSKIRLVQINIVAREVQAEQGLGEAPTTVTMVSGPLQVSDHLHSADPGYNAGVYQQFRRRQLAKTIETRNLGL